VIFFCEDTSQYQINQPKKGNRVDIDHYHFGIKYYGIKKAAPKSGRLCDKICNPKLT